MLNLRLRTYAANLCQLLLLQCETTASTWVLRVHRGARLFMVFDLHFALIGLY